MWKGLIVALVTPFLENGELDLKSFRRLVSWQIKQGVDGLVICGSTGESATLSFLEQQELISAAVDEAKGIIPIIAGTGSNNTRLAVEKTAKAKEIGADACIVEFPYYNRPTFEGCLAHFEKIAECGLPIVVYNHPGRCGVSFSAQKLAKLCEIPGVIALKDCSGDPSFSAAFMKESSKPLFSGDDPLTLPLILEGAQGVISVIGNILPKEWSYFVHTALKGDIEKAKSLYQDLEPLCDALSLETNPQCIKYAMGLKGYLNPLLRLPLLLPQEKARDQIAEAFKAFPS